MDVEYNSIAFSSVKTNALAKTPIWSEDGTTYLYTRVLVDIEGIINPAAMAYALDGGNQPMATPGTLPPVTIAAVRHALSQPRKLLLLTSPTGDTGNPAVTILESPALGFTVDLNNGPKPGSVRVSNFSGARTWYVHWTCETWIHECPGELSIESPILSNRYSQEDQIDEQWKSTRVTTGVTVFRTDILEDTGKTADDFRAYVMPATPAGFQRRKINVTVVPNRNALHWSVTDQEMMYDKGDTQATGTYITDIQGTYGVSSLATEAGIPGGQSIGHLNIRIRGDKRASNWTMTQRAFALAAGKIPLGSPTEGYLTHVSVVQSLVDRDVTLNILYKYVPQAVALIGGVSLDSLRVDSIFPNFGGANPSPPWGKGTVGTSRLKVLATALEEACSGAADPVRNAEGEIAGIGSQDGPPPVTTVFTSDTLPEYPTSYSTTGQENPYNVYDMSTRYHRDANVIMAPTTGVPTTTSGGSGSSGSTLGGTSGTGTGGSGTGTGTGSSTRPPTAVFFRTALPTTTVFVRWAVERVGATPQIPDPDVYNDNYVLLDHVITTVAPQVLPDGNTLVYRIEGEYTYGAVTAMATNENLAMGVVPWVAAKFVDLTVTADDYFHGLIDDDSGGGSTTGY